MRFPFLSSQPKIVPLSSTISTQPLLLVLPYFLFVRFTRKVTSGKVGKLEVSPETRTCNCILRLSVGRARTYGKSSQLALITLEWSTINSCNLPLSLGHGYRVLRNIAPTQLHLTDDVALKSQK